MPGKSLTNTKPLKKRGKSLVAEKKVLWPKAFGKTNADGLHTFPYSQRPDHPAFKPVRAEKELLDRMSYIVDFDSELIYAISSKVDFPYSIVGWAVCWKCKLSINRCRCLAITPPQYISRWREIGLTSDEIRDIHAVKAAAELPKKKLIGSTAKSPAKPLLSRATSLPKKVK